VLHGSPQSSPWAEANDVRTKINRGANNYPSRNGEGSSRHDTTGAERRRRLIPSGDRPDVDPDNPRRFTDSGIEIQTVCDWDDVADLDLPGGSA
jgi:hypothetical protein